MTLLYGIGCDSSRSLCWIPEIVFTSLTKTGAKQGTILHLKKRFVSSGNQALQTERT